MTVAHSAQAFAAERKLLVDEVSGFMYKEDEAAESLEAKRAEKHHVGWVTIRDALASMEMSLTKMGERDLPVLGMGEPRCSL